MSDMPTDYAWITPNTTDQVLGPHGGAAGDVLERIMIVPNILGPQIVRIKDGVAGSWITLFNTAPGVFGLISETRPWIVELGLRSVNGGWHINTGLSVNALAVGDFT